MGSLRILFHINKYNLIDLCGRRSLPSDSLRILLQFLEEAFEFGYLVGDEETPW